MVVIKVILRAQKKFFSWNPHSYTDFYYNFLFSNQRLTIKKVFELGIGTNKVFKDELKEKLCLERLFAYGSNFFQKQKFLAEILMKVHYFRRRKN